MLYPLSYGRTEVAKCLVYRDLIGIGVAVPSDRPVHCTCAGRVFTFENPQPTH